MMRTPPSISIRVPASAEATLPGGVVVQGAADLKRHLVEEKKGAFARALTSRLLAYALGRSLELGDHQTVDQLAGRFVGNGYNIKSLIEDIVLSEPFLTK